MKDILSIAHLGAQGDGVHQNGSDRVYVERALPGEAVRVKHRGKEGGLPRADLLEVITASPARVAAPCVHYDLCGGCSLQHADEAFYRDWKSGVVADILTRNGLTPARWLPPVFLPPGQRRRVTFAAHKKGKNLTLGYFRRRTHTVTDITACLIADPALMDLRAKLIPLLLPILQDGKPADIFLQHVDGAVELVITGPIGARGGPDFALHEAFAALVHATNIARISWRPRERDTPEVMLAARPLFARFGTLDVALPPLAFLQPTKAGENALVEAVMTLLPAHGAFADLFAGCGTFSGPMVARGSVEAFDSVAPAINALDKAKGAAPLRATVRDLFRDPLRPEELKRFDAVVFDPPRVGAREQVGALAVSQCPVIVGVSCNPATFARDARLLVEGGYTLDSVQVVDQFTWSHHVEVVAGFSKTNP